MNIYIDTETQGLNTQQFVMGVVIDAEGIAHHYDDRHEMKAHIERLANYCRVRKKTLLIYAHNMLFDYHVLHHADEPTNTIIYCHDPFIADQKDNNDRIYAKWLSTTSLWYGALDTMGEAVGLPKGDTPEWLKQDEYHDATPEQREQAHIYMEQDARIVEKYMKDLIERLTHARIKPRWVLTGAQIGIQRLLAVMRQATNANAFFADKYQQRFHETTHKEELHEALRGGRVQAHTLGKHEHATSIDLNSHYPDALRSIRMPDLRTQTRHKQPLRRGYKLLDILQKIGISHAIVRIEKGTPYGVLPVREDNEHTNYPNRPGDILIGTWTHTELEAAHARGWTILDIAWTHTWEETENPFPDMVAYHYQLKNEATTGVEKAFHKLLLNGGIGKFAQRRENYSYVWANIEEEHTYLKQGYEAIETSGTERLYRRTEGITYPKHYAPIVNALVTAHARIKLLKCMEEIPPEHLYYTDTDSIIAYSKAIQKGRFKYGKELGEWKVVVENEPIEIKGKKAYKHGTNVKLSGVGKRWATTDAWNNGSITYKRMRTAASTPDKTLIGTFEERTVRIDEIEQNAREHKKRTESVTVHVDAHSQQSPYATGAIEWTR